MKKMLLVRQSINNSVTISLKTLLCFETHSNKTQLHIILKGFKKIDDSAVGPTQCRTVIYQSKFLNPPGVSSHGSILYFCNSLN